MSLERVRGKRGRGAFGKTKVFGMKKRGDKVYTQVVSNCSASELVPIIIGAERFNYLQQRELMMVL